LSMVTTRDFSTVLIDSLSAGFRKKTFCAAV
jgi:hypothetical protein